MPIWGKSYCNFCRNILYLEKSKGGFKHMGKKVNSIKKMASKVLMQIGMKAADISCNQSCIYIAYEPKQPKVMKKRNKRNK